MSVDLPNASVEAGGKAIVGVDLNSKEQSPRSTDQVSWPLQVPGSAEDVMKAPYPDFVAMINEVNVPPGGHDTLRTWVENSSLTNNSKILEIACTTGFSSRTLAQMTGCTATGFDISEPAVAVARYNHEKQDKSLPLTYLYADGQTFDSRQTFSHIVTGGALSFFPDPPAMVNRLVQLLQPGGYLLASPYWFPKPLPERLAMLRREILGITIPPKQHAGMMAFYRHADFDLVYEARIKRRPETLAEVKKYCESVIGEACRQSGIRNTEVRDAMLTRFREIRELKNQLREYLWYSVLVLRRKNWGSPEKVDTVSLLR